jgi:hypothetical protein
MPSLDSVSLVPPEININVDLSEAGENLFSHKPGTFNQRSIELIRSPMMEPTELQRVENLSAFLQGLLEHLGEAENI